MEVNLVLVLGITSLTTPFFSGPPLSPGLRLGQWMRVDGLCSCSVQMNHGLWEGWWKDCTLPQGFIRPGLPFLTAYISPTKPWLLKPRPTWLAPTPGSRRLFKALFMLLSALPPPRPETDFTWNVALNVWKKYKLEGCQNTPSFSHYSHSNKTPVGPFPRDLTFCQPILYIRHAVEEIRGWPTLNPMKRSGRGMY